MLLRELEITRHRWPSTLLFWLTLTLIEITLSIVVIHLGEIIVFLLKLFKIVVILVHVGLEFRNVCQIFINWRERRSIVFLDLSQYQMHNCAFPFTKSHSHSLVLQKLKIAFKVLTEPISFNNENLTRLEQVLNFCSCLRVNVSSNIFNKFVRTCYQWGVNPDFRRTFIICEIYEFRDVYHAVNDRFFVKCFTQRGLKHVARVRTTFIL
jgi:hypothetical protein